MKRKILTLALVLTMAFALVINAGAVIVPSVAGEAAPAVTGATAGDGTVIPAEDLTVTSMQDVSELPPEVRETMEKAYSEITSAESVEVFLETSGVMAGVTEALADTNVKPAELAPACVFDVSASGAAAEILAANGSVTLTFAVPAVSANSAVVVLHYNANIDGNGNGGWEVVPASAGDGTVSATFTSLSPVVIMTQSSTTSEGNGTVNSPQTSDINLEGVLFCGIAVGLAAFVLCLKRSRMA